MSKRNKHILLLALGNEIMGDDAAALLAAREVQRLDSDEIDIVEAPVAGFALMDLLQGYEKVLIVDSAVTGDFEPGSIHEMSVSQFHGRTFSSPHFAGLKDVIDVATRLEIPFPSDIRILAIEVVDPFVLRESLTPEISARLPELVHETRSILQSWLSEIPEQISA